MHDSALNDAARRAAYDSLENGNHSPTLTRRSTGADSLDSASSPFINNVDGDSATSQSSNQENVSPSKDKRRSRIMSGSEMSSLKLLSSRSSSDATAPITESQQQQQQQQHQHHQSLDDKLAPPAPKSPRKSISPMRRFPVRTNTGEAPSGRFNRPQSIPPPVKERDEEEAESNDEIPTERPRSHPHTTEITLEEAIAQNPGVKHAIEIFEDTLDSMGDSDEDDTNIPEEATPKGPTDGHEPDHGGSDQHESMGDETMMSEFSDFSAIPSMTTFARLGGRTPSQMAQGSSTTNLLDFTDSLRFPGRRQSPTRSMTVADTSKTPQRQSIANLLDFEIPPMPTPRSVPTISARELESLKSNFMSEISNLRATLSGKEAEATSLRTALIDAEKRVGESMEQLREERSLREQNAEEKDTWEKRGREMETVLRQVKDEIMTTQREREMLESRLEESEGRREAAEMMAQEAESKIAAMRASRVGGGGEAANSPRSPKNTTSQREIELAVEKVARELHAAYKSKHEAKVAALKKNYEVRWDKKIRELEAKIEELTKENEELRVGRDATLTKVEFEASERSAQAVKDSAQIKELHAEVEKLEAVLKTVRGDNDELRHQLEGERVEKGELVTLAEELMQMQSNQSVVVQNSEPAFQQELHQNHHYQQQQQQQQQVEHSTPPKRVAQRASAPVPPRGQTAMGVSRSTTTTTMTPRRTAPSPSGIPGNKSGFRNSMIGRPPGVSGLKAPGSIAGGSRIGGGAAAHSRAGSSVPASGLARPGSSLARPGGLMNSIQQMGSYRGRGE